MLRSLGCKSDQPHREQAMVDALGIGTIPVPGRWYSVRLVNANQQNLFLNVFAGEFGRILNHIVVAPAAPHHKFALAQVGDSAYEIRTQQLNRVVGRQQGKPLLDDYIVISEAALWEQRWNIAPSGA